MSKINFHPDHSHLLAFATGEGQPGTNLMVSAHLDLCPMCREKVREIEAQQAHSEIEIAALDMMPGNYAAMLNSIMAKPLVADDVIGASYPKTIELDGRHFALPRTLQRYVHKTGNWSRLVGKLWQAPVDLGGVGSAHFIYMEKGGRVPEHTHRGSELTLVLDGEFSDGLNHYETGDMTFLDGRHQHTPMSDADEGCLVFSLVDKPLHFTSGLARLLNPFSHLFMK